MPRNERLRQHRIERNWRQQEVADQLGIALVTVQRWERGYQEPSAYYRIKLSKLFGLSAQELGLLEESSLSAPPEREANDAEQPDATLPDEQAQRPSMPDLPTGSITFLFTDIESSITRWDHHPQVMRTALARHNAILRQIITAHGGFVFTMKGDAVYAVFAVASGAISTAVAAQQAVVAEVWDGLDPPRVRMALHTGTAQHRDDDYFGPTLNRVERLLSTGYGGQILFSTVTYELVRDSLPAGVSVKDLGEHALKDLLRHEHIYQLVIPDLPTEFPPLRSLERHPNNLPMQPTAFVGREREVTSVCALLRQPQTCLVTLTGPGGIGKTRLGLHVAAELVDQFIDGVFLVPLAPVSDPEKIIPAIIQTLGISDLSSHPLMLLTAALKGKHMLLLLDSFEHVITAAVLVAELLAACPRLKILVTSQVVLRVQAEREFAVLPLSVPNLKRLPDIVTFSQFEAVALFIERAQTVKPDFQVTNANAPAVAGICAKLDGLPLAIELAAARSKFFAPQALLTRLEQGLTMLTGGARDLPARQQTLHGAIAWSYTLLAPQEQQLFRRFSVFVDGCMWEAAEEVCRAAGELEGDVLDGLLSLVDKSLLRQEESAEGEPRFWMLQTLREFGLEALAGETESTRQAHAEYYLGLAEEAEPHLKGTEQTRWFAQLDREYENLRAALSFLLERARAQTGQQQDERALRLCVALSRFWYNRGKLREGRSFLEHALSGRSDVATPLRAKALHAAGELAWTQEDFEQAEVLGGESLALFRELGNTGGIADCLNLVGSAARERGQYSLGRSRLEEAAALYSELGDRWKQGQCFTELARLATSQGEYDRAGILLEESLVLYRTLGDHERISWVLYLLAQLRFLSQTDPVRAHALAEQSLALSREIGADWNQAYVLGLLAQMRLVQGELVEARDLAEQSIAIFREVGDQEGTAEPRMCLARVAVLQGEWVMALRCYQECLAMLHQFGIMIHFPSCLEGLAAVVAAQGEPLKSARLWGRAEALREDMGALVYPVDRPEYERAVEDARTHFGEEAFAAAWAEGRIISLAQVIDEVFKMDVEAGKQ